MKNQKKFQSLLLGGISIVALTATANLSIAADATTEVSNGTSVTANDANGLLESDADNGGAVGITIDTGASPGTITLGADGGNDAITLNAAGADTTLTITKNGTGELILAEDVNVSARAGNNLVINHTAGVLTINGDIDEADGASSTIVASDGTVINIGVNLDTDADITASSNSDTVTLNISNPGGGTNLGNNIFGAIGASGKIAVINMEENSWGYFRDTVNAGVININSTNQTVGFLGSTVTSDIHFATNTNETVTLGTSTALTGNISTVANHSGTVVFADAAATSTVMTGNAGADNARLAYFQLGAQAGQTATLAGNVFTQNFKSSGDGIVTVDGTVDANLIDTTAAGHTRFNQAVTTNVLFVNGGSAFMYAPLTAEVVFNSDKQAAFSADNFLTGSARTNTAGQGSLLFPELSSSATVVSGNVGESGKNIRLFSLGANSGQTATAGGNVFADNIFASGAGTVDFNGTVTGNLGVQGAGTVNIAGTITGTTNFAADGVLNIAAGQALSGSVTTDNAGQGTVNFLGNTSTGALGIANARQLKAINFNAGTVGINGDINADTVTTANGTTLNLTTRSIGGDFNNDATLNLTGTVTFTGTSDTIDLSTGGNAVLAIGAASDYTNGVVFNASTNSVNLSNSLVINPLIGFKSGTVTLVDGVAANNNIDENISNIQVSGNAVFASYVPTLNGGKIDIVATESTPAQIAAKLGITEQEAASLIEINTMVQEVTNASSPDAATLTDAQNTEAVLAVGTRQNASDASIANLKALARQGGLQADILTASNEAMIDTGGRVFAVAQQRMDAVRTSNVASAQSAGFSTGDLAENVGVWMKPFGTWNNQDSDDGIAGYDSATYGIAFGADTEVTPDLRVGVSGAYAKTDVDGDSGADLDVKSYQATLYADYTADSYYIEAMAGFAHNQAETRRTISLTTDTAEAEYDNNQYMAAIHAGMPLQISENSYVTPTVGFDWTFLEGDSYTETGAGAFNQSVNQEDATAFIGSLGVKYHQDIAVEKGVFSPELRGGIRYDFAGDEAEAVSSFVNGGSSFRTEGIETEAFGGYAGVGFTYREDGFSASLGYDAEVKQNFVSHNASLELRFEF